jgi:adenylate cyclase
VRGDINHILGRVRLTTGLVLFFYVLTHNLNHALGLVSLDAMEWGRGPFLAFWRFEPVELVFLLSALVHFLLGARALYNRHSLHMPFWEGAQLVLGLSIPPLLILHFLGTVVAHEIFSIDDAYDETILALLGFAEAGREVLRLMQEPGWFHELALRRHLPGRDAVARLYAWRDNGLIGYAVIVVGVLAARYLRIFAVRRRSIRVVYPDGTSVNIQPGTTILEASRIGGIPHASVCGGRGRCSTCRVRILAGEAALPPPSLEELRVLARVGAAPGTRLACQVRPGGYVKVAPLLPPSAGPRSAQARGDFHSGKEQEIAVLFADLRDFTRFSERQLPTWSSS